MSAGLSAFRAGLCSDRATDQSEWAHAVLTAIKSPVFARDRGMLTDCESVSQGVRDAR